MVRKILSVFIALLFLLSSTGVYLVKHTCLHTGYTRILLVEKHDSCKHHLDNTSCPGEYSAGVSCPVHGDHNNCCVNKIVFLKGSSNYQKPETRVSVNVPFFKPFEIHCPGNLSRPEPSQFCLIASHLYNNPREVLIKNHSLIL